MEQSVSGFVYESVLKDIFSDLYKPNQIIRERELCEKYGCSKTSVREALVALCHEGVLKSIPRCGYEVIHIEARRIRDILQYRFILESGCLLQVLDQVTPEQLQSLRDVNIPCGDSQDNVDVWTHWESNQKFHLELIGLCGNQFAYENLREAMNILKRAYAQYYWNKWERVSAPCDTRSHSSILDALEQKDPEALKKALREDLMDFAY